MYSTSIYMVINAFHAVKPCLISVQWTIVIIILTIVFSLLSISIWDKYFPAKPKEVNKAEEALRAKRFAEKGEGHE